MKQKRVQFYAHANDIKSAHNIIFFAVAAAAVFFCGSSDGVRGKISYLVTSILIHHNGPGMVDRGIYHIKELSESLNIVFHPRDFMTIFIFFANTKKGETNFLRLFNGFDDGVRCFGFDVNACDLVRIPIHIEIIVIVAHHHRISS